MINDLKVSRLEGDRTRGDLHFPSINSKHQCLHICGNEINHIEPHGFFRRYGNALDHCQFRPMRVAFSKLRQGTDIGGGIVDNLVFHGFRLFALASPTHHIYRMGGTNIGTRCHGGNMGGYGDERSR